MTIEIVYAERVEEELVEGVFVWVCWLEISQSGQTWMLPTTAPGTLAKGELQAHFDARESELWSVAQQKQYTADLYDHVGPRHVLKAFAAVMLEETNILRQLHGLAPRTAAQLRQAVKAEL